MQREVVAAYDAISGEYDRQVEGDQWMRQVLWAHYKRIFRPGQRVLDIACGTGIDTIFLAQQGVQVTALDLAPGMIAQLQTKLASQQLAGQVEAHVMDFAALASWPPETFDGIISSFAGLNTVPDLRPFAANAAHVLRPGGHLVVHLLNGFSLWEWLGLLWRGQWRKARHLGQEPERTFLIGGQHVRHYLFFPDDAYRRFFSPAFHLRGAYGLGILRPPHSVRRIPSPVVAALHGLERRLHSRRPFIRWGRFFVLDLEKRGTGYER